MITGTFLDEISHDIPSNNWDAEDWDRDFQAMKAIGIDTVLLVRAGYRDKATFDSKVLRKLYPSLIASDDLVGLFLSLAEKHGLTFYFGTYDSGDYWNGGEYQKEIDINRAFCDEFMERYGSSPALGGWYISHEINAFNEGMMDVYQNLAKHLKSLKDQPILIAPYIRGVKQFPDDAITLNQHVKEWDQVFDRIKDCVDIVAFQDGHVHFNELEDYLTANAELAHKYGITCWSNVETFDRDMPFNFPPLEWRKLKFKIDAAAKTGVDKLVTFEFSHFMSPNSCWPSAHGLYKRFKAEYVDGKAR